MRPLDSLSSLKMKLGAVIVAAVAVTVVVVTVGAEAGLHPFLGGLLAGALALAMVQFLARGMTSPLREMAGAARQMARGDYSRRVTESSRDEVGELARSFNRMAGELEQVDRMRRDLVANVSHELRTPTTALQAVLENLVDEVEPPDRSTFVTMLAQVERLGRLVEQLLDLSRLESGATMLRIEPFELSSLLEQAARETRLSEKSVEVRVEVEPADLKANGDPERIHQVVANLLNNAVRYSPEGGVIELRAAAHGDGVRIEVSDQGPGIPPDEAERVFERFYRADIARSPQAGGTGLGLAIARWIVELHQGEIYVDRDRREGCRVIVQLGAAA